MVELREELKKTARGREKKATLAPAISPEGVVDGRPGACLIKKNRPDDTGALVREFEYIANLPED